MLNIKKIADKDIDLKAKPFKELYRNEILFTSNPYEIINDPEIDIVVELIGE